MLSPARWERPFTTGLTGGCRPPLMKAAREGAPYKCGPALCAGYAAATGSRPRRRPLQERVFVAAAFAAAMLARPVTPRRARGHICMARLRAPFGTVIEMAASRPSTRDFRSRDTEAQRGTETASLRRW